MVKLIVTDVDDTLVPEAGSVINSEYYDICLLYTSPSPRD